MHEEQSNRPRYYSVTKVVWVLGLFGFESSLSCIYTRAKAIFFFDLLSLRYKHTDWKQCSRLVAMSLSCDASDANFLSRNMEKSKKITKLCFQISERLQPAGKIIQCWLQYTIKTLKISSIYIKFDRKMLQENLILTRRLARLRWKLVLQSSICLAVLAVIHSFHISVWVRLDVHRTRSKKTGWQKASSYIIIILPRWR